MESVRTADDEMFSALEPVISEIPQLISRHKAPKTLQALVGFAVKGNSLKTGIFDLYDSKNLYGMKVLYRSLIEHYLKFMYLFR